MIFSPQLARLVLSGRKTQTRRKVKDSDCNEFGMWICRYRAGHDYSVQPGRGKSGIAHITITSTPEIVTLGDLTLQDARAEGFRVRADFARYWLALHRQHMSDRDDDLADDELWDQFVDRAGHTRVWRIEFQINHDTDRFMARRPGAPYGDYVPNHHLALDGDAPTISERTQAMISHAAFQRDDADRRAAIRAATDAIEEQIEAVRALDPGTRVTKAVDRVQRTTEALKRIA